jgi:hypothetical protein
MRFRWGRAAVTDRLSRRPGITGPGISALMPELRPRRENRSRRENETFPGEAGNDFLIGEFGSVGLTVAFRCLGLVVPDFSVLLRAHLSQNSFSSARAFECKFKTWNRRSQRAQRNSQIMHAASFNAVFFVTSGTSRYGLRSAASDSTSEPRRFGIANSLCPSVPSCSKQFLFSPRVWMQIQDLEQEVTERTRLSRSLALPTERAIARSPQVAQCWDGTTSPDTGEFVPQSQCCPNPVPNTAPPLGSKRE